MATGSASIHVEASPEAVYDLIADVRRMGEWSPETYRTEWRPGWDRAVPGARFRGWNKAGPLRWFTTPRVDVADRGSALQFTVVLAGRIPSTTWRYDLAPDGTGTLVTESWETHLPVLRRIYGGWRVDMLQRGMQQTLERIKAAAEG